MTNDRVHEIQSVLRSLGIPGWLLYNFRDTNPISERILGISGDVHQSRRWACLIPAEGEIRGLAHRIEPHIARLMPGEVIRYSSHQEFGQGLRSLVGGLDQVAMEYSPGNALPVVSKVDAGTVEYVRSLGVEVISSGTLIAYLEARLSQEQLDSAIRAGGAMREIVMGAFGFIRDRIRASTRVTEYDVQQWILAEFERRKLVTDHPANCSVGPNSSNPHYEPTAGGGSEIREGDFVLIDLWGREEGDGSVYGDITWTGFVGESVPERYEEIFQIVREARDAAYRGVCEAFESGEPVSGGTLDDLSRQVIRQAGYEDYFVHRTGHSITTELHGAGANLDNFETMDDRPILSATSFSIEPGIYLPGEFGVRSELDVVVTVDGRVLATSEPLQQKVVPILGTF
jgi:Xaa-Pro aminopeptidase